MEQKICCCCLKPIVGHNKPHGSPCKTCSGQICEHCGNISQSDSITLCRKVSSSGVNFQPINILTKEKIPENREYSNSSCSPTVDLFEGYPEQIDNITGPFNFDLPFWPIEDGTITISIGNEKVFDDGQGGLVGEYVLKGKVDTNKGKVSGLIFSKSVRREDPAKAEYEIKLKGRKEAQNFTSEASTIFAEAIADLSRVLPKVSQGYKDKWLELVSKYDLWGEWIEKPTFEPEQIESMAKTGVMRDKLGPKIMEELEALIQESAGVKNIISLYLYQDIPLEKALALGLIYFQKMSENQFKAIFDHNMTSEQKIELEPVEIPHLGEENE